MPIKFKDYKQWATLPPLFSHKPKTICGQLVHNAPEPFTKFLYQHTNVSINTYPSCTSVHKLLFSYPEVAWSLHDSCKILAINDMVLISLVQLIHLVQYEFSNTVYLVPSNNLFITRSKAISTLSLLLA